MRVDISGSLAAATVLVTASAPLAHDDGDDGLQFVRSSLVCKQYDGATDDLLTAGLGKDGLGNPAPPAVPAKPTAAGAAPARDLEQLSRARRHEHQGRLRGA